MSHRLFLPACHVRQQELQPGAVVLLAGAGWLASFLGIIMCCAEKCVRVRGVAVLPQPTAPRPPPYNPEYLKTLVRTCYSPVCLRVRRCVCVCDCILQAQQQQQQQQQRAGVFELSESL